MFYRLYKKPMNNKDVMLDSYISKEDREIIRKLGNANICAMLSGDQDSREFCLEILKQHGVKLLYENTIINPNKWEYNWNINVDFYNFHSLEHELYKNYNIPYEGCSVFTGHGKVPISLSVVKYLKEYNN